MTELVPVAASPASRIAGARSALFVPGDRPERFAKAAASGTDLVIIDLEDAVAAEHKTLARQHMAQWLADEGQAAVRINAVPSEHYHDDWSALVEKPGLLAVMVPMAEDPLALAGLAGDLDGRVPVIALIETALGVVRAREIAEVEGVVRLGIGHLDLAVDLGSSDNRTALLLSRSTLVLASRAAGIAGPMDGVTTALDDVGVCIDDARYARELGFSGKLAIHPTQVEPVNTAFSPSEDEVAWAEKVIEVAGQDGSAVRVDGQMVDPPVIDMARQTLARAWR